MDLKCIGRYAGFALMVAGALWSAGAAWLTATLVISATAEFLSYWLWLCAILVGAFLYIVNQNNNSPPLIPILRGSCIVVALVVFFVSWSLSNKQFAYWKMKAIPQDSWPEMIADLNSVGKVAANNDSHQLPWPTVLPKSLQGLGLNVDYKGGMFGWVNSAEYTGLSGHIVFGNKLRTWGLFLGRESDVRQFCRRGMYNRVAPNAFFFVSRRT